MFSELSFNKEGLAHGSKIVRYNFYNVFMIQNGMWMGQWIAKYGEKGLCVDRTFGSQGEQKLEAEGY